MTVQLTDIEKLEWEGRHWVVGNLSVLDWKIGESQDLMAAKNTYHIHDLVYSVVRHYVVG